MFLRILIGVLLLLHGLIHWLLAVMPNPQTDKPVVATFFSEWANPWLQSVLSAGTVQVIAVILAILAGVGFFASGLAMFDVVLPHDWWRALAIASSLGSLLLCLLYWNSYLIAGPLIAIGIILVVGLLQWPTKVVLGY